MKHGLKLVFTAVVLAVFLCGGAITYSRLRYAIPLGPVSNLTFGDAANAASPQQFRLLVWNVYKGQRGNWVDEFQKVAADFDFFLLQEALVDDGQQNVFSQTPKIEWQYAPSFYYKRSTRSTGVLTGARCKALRSMAVRSAGREPLFGTPKMSSFTLYNVRGCSKPLLAANIHALLLASPQSFRGQLQRLKDALREHDGPVVLGGDFNTWSRTRAKILAEVISSLGLRRVDFVPDTRTKVLGRPIDHVFTKGCVVRSAEVLSASDSSDHRALGVVIDCRNASCAGTD